LLGECIGLLEKKQVGMSQARDGDIAKVHYEIRLANGKVLATTKGKQAIEAKIGSQGPTMGFEKGLIGMEPGETKAIRIPTELACGLKQEELIGHVPRSDLPNNIVPAIGKRVSMTKPDGEQVDATITAIDEGAVTLDANHPLAGETLVFEVQLVAVPYTSLTLASSSTTVVTGGTGVSPAQSGQIKFTLTERNFDLVVPRPLPILVISQIHLTTAGLKYVLEAPESATRLTRALAR